MSGTRVGVVGCGLVAERFHLPALASIPRTRDGIVLVDTDPLRVAEMADRIVATKILPSHEELVGEVDGVIIATPPSTHHRIAHWCLERGLPVLSEKPLTESRLEAEDLVAMAERTGTALAVNQTRRLFPTYQHIRRLCLSGELGEIRSIVYHDGIEFRWPVASGAPFRPGVSGALSDKGVHLIDTICYWLDATPELVSSQNDSGGGPEAMATLELRHGQTEIELKVSRLGELRNGFRIEGTKGVIEAEVENWNEITVVASGGIKETIRCGLPKDTGYNDFAVPLIENFADVIEGTGSPLVTGADTLPAVRILDEAYRQAARYPMPWFGSPGAGTTSQLAADEAPIPRVLVTGASGFLGGRLVESMWSTGWATPVGTVLHWPRAVRAARLPIELTQCDITDPASVERAVAGVDAIVHCAKTDSFESIVGGTRNVLLAAERLGVGRVVFVSSAEVYGPNASGDVTEEASTEAVGRVYGDAKIEAEELCRSFAERGVSTTILRPSLIYGPFSSSWSVRMAKRLVTGNWSRFATHADGIANLVYVDDMVAAIRLSLDRTSEAPETYNVNGPDRLTWNEYFELFNSALGLPDLRTVSPSSSRLRTGARDTVSSVINPIQDRFRRPLMDVYLRGGVASRLMKQLKLGLSTTPSSTELLGLYSRRARYDDAKLRRDLGYRPAVDIGTGLARTVAWLELNELAKE